MPSRRMVISGARRRGRRSLRPTSARVRAALFDSLSGVLEDALVLDLFAGTGALGIEALHRGARRVVFVERDPAHCRVLRRAIERAGLAERGDVRQGDVLLALDRMGRAGTAFDVILLDPPYGQGWIGRTLDALACAGILRPGGVIAAEGHWRDRPVLGPGWVLAKEARYGETALWYIRAESGQQSGVEGGAACA